MSSWANLKTVPQKKFEPTLQSWYSPATGDYVSDTLLFLYSFAYSQRSAEPFYIQDTKGFFQPLLKPSAILHFLKEQPSSGTQLTLSTVKPVLEKLFFPSFKRTVSSIYEFNGMTSARIINLLQVQGLFNKVFDVGIVLDVSGCVGPVIASLKQFQRRTGKKKLEIFVMTDSEPLLGEFVFNGDPSWNYRSLLSTKPIPDPETRLLKTLAEINVLQGVDTLVVRLSSPIGKLLYLTSRVITSESSLYSYDGSSWSLV
jgi:hypothetical protein